MAYEIKKYPDNSSYVVAEYGTKTPHIIYKINSYDDLWKLNQLVDSLNYQGITPTIKIPNLIDAQADRRFDTNQSSGLKLVCKFLNGMKANFQIFHPHNPEVVEALMNNVEIINNIHFIEDVLFNISQQRFQTNIHDSLIIMSPDAGAFKPLMSLCDKLNWEGETTSASKYRYYDKGNSILAQIVPTRNFEGKDVLIVDDICVNGGTFKGLANLLKERNCGKIYLAVSHLTVQNHKGDDTVFDYFDKVYTTNSKFDSYWRQNKKGEQIKPENLEILKSF